jgi:hypothetical protein
VARGIDINVSLAAFAFAMHQHSTSLGACLGFDLKNITVQVQRSSDLFRTKIKEEAGGSGR